MSPPTVYDVRQCERAGRYGQAAGSAVRAAIAAEGANWTRAACSHQERAVMLATIAAHLAHTALGER